MKALNQKKKCDIIIPMVNCKPTYWLNKFRLRFCSFPLDYMHGYKLESIINLIRENFVSFLQDIEIDVSKKPTKKYHYVLDKKNGIYAMHHYLNTQTLESQKDLVYDKMQKRYQLLVNLLKKSKRVCFVTSFAYNEENFRGFISALKEKYPNLQIFILNVIHSPSSPYTEDVHYFDNASVVNIICDDSYDGTDKDLEYIGNQKLWKNIVSQLSLSFKFFKKRRSVNFLRRILSRVYRLVRK